MTQKHTPDRIWAWQEDDDFMRAKPHGVSVSQEYLLATPTREAAPDLLAALIDAKAMLQLLSTPDDAMAQSVLQQTRAAIAKTKGEAG